MKYLEKFYEWNNPIYTYTSTGGEPTFDYISKDKIYYGIHTVTLKLGDKVVDVKAKFDTGARSSSIDYSVARKLGFSTSLIKKCKDLSRLRIDKNIDKKEQKRLETKYTKELRSIFPEISKVKTVKSSSGFSIRIFIKLDIHYQGFNITGTEVNLRDRTGLTAEMLVGLKDML